MKFLLALLVVGALSACTQEAFNRSLYDSANNRGSMQCETLPDTERVKCKERESVQYRDYKAQRDLATGTVPSAASNESFEDYQKRRD